MLEYTRVGLVPGILRYVGRFLRELPACFRCSARAISDPTTRSVRKYAFVSHTFRATVAALA